MRKLVYVLFIAFFSLACEETIERPADVLESADMVNVIVDVEKIESHLRTLPPDKDGTVESKILYGRLLRKHGITQEQFKKSYQYWRDHPKQFQTMYETALAQIKSEEVEFNGR